MCTTSPCWIAPVSWGPSLQTVGSRSPRIVIGLPSFMSSADSTRLPFWHFLQVIHNDAKQHRSKDRSKDSTSLHPPGRAWLIGCDPLSQACTCVGFPDSRVVSVLGQTSCRGTLHEGTSAWIQDGGGDHWVNKPFSSVSLTIWTCPYAAQLCVTLTEMFGFWASVGWLFRKTFHLTSLLKVLKASP